VRFLWAKGLNAKNILKEMYPVYGGKCLSHKAVHIWVKEFSQGRSKVADDAGPGAEVAEAAVKKKNLWCGFRHTGKAKWDECINVGGGYARKLIFSQVRISHVLRFIYICDLCTDSPSYTERESPNNSRKSQMIYGIRNR
jgi:hypothetical protein